MFLQFNFTVLSLVKSRDLHYMTDVTVTFQNFNKKILGHYIRFLKVQNYLGRLGVFLFRSLLNKYYSMRKDRRNDLKNITFTSDDRIILNLI